MNEKAAVTLILGIWLTIVLANLAMLGGTVYLLGHYCFHWF